MGITKQAILFHKNFIGQIRQMKRNVMLFVIPIFIFLFVVLFFDLNKVEENFIEPIKIGLIVEDDSPYGAMLADGLLSTKGFTEFILVTMDDRVTIHNSFQEGKFDAMLLMPEGYVDSVMHFESNPIEVKVNYTDPLKAVLIRNILMAYEKYITSVEAGVLTLHDQMEAQGFDDEHITAYNEKISIDLIFTAIARSGFYEFQEIVNVPSVASTLYYFIAIITMFFMYISVFVGINLIREREEMCFVRLKLSKISVLNYMVSKALSSTIFIGLIALGWFILFMVFTKGSFSHGLTSLLCFLLIAIFFDISLTMLMTAYFEREDSVVLLSNVFIFINAIIGGSIIPLQMMPESLSKLAIISPNYWMIRASLYMQSGYNFKEGLIIGITLLIISIGMLVLTSQKYKKSW